jgi:multidrug efflux pump subunit AcrA (membrane-fusion protein)
MTDRPRTSQETFDLSEDEISPEHLDSQVQKAQEQLLSLKRQQELIERQKRELEELSRRQDQLQTGRSELIEKLTRALVVVEREEYEAHRRVDMLKNVRESFGQHLQFFETLDLKGLEGAELNRELTRALSALDDANADLKSSYPKVDSGGSQPVAYEQSAETGGNAEFFHWLKIGVAFTLPLTVTGLLLFFALLSSK